MTELRFKSVFDIIGPVMVGPSSSHTAGAARIGKVVHDIFGEKPEKVTIHLYESFAKTYRGHGTDIALVGGLLGMEPDDKRLSDSLKIAYEKGIKVAFVPESKEVDHPNTAKIKLVKGDHNLTVTVFRLVEEIFKFQKSMVLRCHLAWAHQPILQSIKMFLE
jgi:L-serine deaminase